MKYSGGFKFAFLACIAVVLSIYVAIYCLESDTGSSYLINSPETLTVMFSMKIPMNDDLRSIPEATDRPYFLQENFYKKSCPHAEKIIRTSLRDMYDAKPSIAPSLVRLLFHDCFIGVRFCYSSFLCFSFFGSANDKCIWSVLLWYLCFRS